MKCITYRIASFGADIFKYAKILTVNAILLEI